MTVPLPSRTERIERAARALYERDARRSIGLASADYVWPRVADEYRAQAQTALGAMQPTETERLVATLANKAMND